MPSPSWCRRPAAWLPALAAACLAGGPAATAAAAVADHLVLSEVVVQVRTSVPASKYVELVNPTAAAIDLSNVYLTDATFNSPPTYYYNVVRLDGTSGGGASGDFHARFPAGASIAAGDTVVVAIMGSGEYQTAYGRLPDYELFEDGLAPDGVPELVEVFPGSVGRGLGTANANTTLDLASGGETVVLYRWDGQGDLVQDLDYLIWGTTSTLSVRTDKTGVSVDGPDADGAATAYLADTATSAQQAVATSPHNFGDSFQRRSLDEGAETAAGGNGLNGHNETSEPLAATWRADADNTPPAAPAAFAPPAPIITAATLDPAAPVADAPVTVQATVLAHDAVQAVTLHYSAGGGAFVDVAGANTGGNAWSAQIPAQAEGTVVRWYVTADGAGGGRGVRPGGAPAYAGSFTVQAAPDYPPLLLITEVCALGTANEFVEIVNPNAAPVDLSNYYLTDAIYSTGQQYYWRIVQPNPGQTTVGGGKFTDFHARFPDGATIAAGDTITVSVAGSDAFESAWGVSPTYELFEDGGGSDGVPDMREVFPGSINGVGVQTDGTVPTLTNASEIIVLYHWNGQTDLVTDIDVFAWGSTTTNLFSKTGVAIDGPDADTTPTAYQPDWPVGSQQTFPAEHAFGNSYQRVDENEGTEVKTGGNGTLGHNETSENVAATFAELPASPATPGGGETGGGGIALEVPAFTFIPRDGEEFPVRFRTRAQSQTEVRIYDLAGRLVVTLFDSRFDGAAATAPDRLTERRWNGRDREFELVPAGTYVVHLSVTGNRTGDQETRTAPVVVATRLSD